MSLSWYILETNPHVQSYKKIKLGCGCSCVASSCWTEEREGRSSWRADFYSGGLLFSMGLLGYIFSRSTISLVLGITPGLATLLLGTLSLKFWRSDRSSFLLILAQAAISAFLAWKYSHAYFLTNRLLPWGFYASLSTAMGCFYAYVLLAGGNPPPKKLAAIPPQ